MITPTIDARKQRILKACGSEPRTMDELAWAVIKTIESTKTDQYNGQNLCKVVGFAWAMWHGTVRNTHSAPMNGEQNWSASDPNIPTGYPGWNGRVWIRYKDRNTSGSSEAFRSTLTYPGTGGGGSYNGFWESICTERWNRYKFSTEKDTYPEINCYSWDYRIYESDWPLLQSEIQKQQVFDTLAGNVFSHNHNFCWEDPDTRMADQAFLAECAMIAVKNLLKEIK